MTIGDLVFAISNSFVPLLIITDCLKDSLIVTEPLRGISNQY